MFLINRRKETRLQRLTRTQMIFRPTIRFACIGTRQHWSLSSNSITPNLILSTGHARHRWHSWSSIKKLHRWLTQPSTAKNPTTGLPRRWKSWNSTSPCTTRCLLSFAIFIHIPNVASMKRMSPLLRKSFAVFVGTV